MRRRRSLLLLSACLLLLAPATAAAQELDYVDLEGRKLLGLRLAGPGAVAGSALTTGDFDGDGTDDLVVGAHGASPRGRRDAGGVEVLYGPIVGRRPKDRLLILGAEPMDRTGISVADAGDLDGDGAAELAIGAYQASPLGRPGAGLVYIVPGRSTGVVDLADPAANVQRILGARPSDNVGRSLAGIGDQDGDGVADLLVGAPGADPGGRFRAGAAYVTRGFDIPGRVLDLAAPLGDWAFRIAGPGDGAVAGWSVAGGGDRDGDGDPDYAIGAPEDLARAGRVFLVAGGWRPGGIDLGTRPPGVTRIVGPRPGHLLGFSLADVGDFNDDGTSDIAAGAWGASPRGRRQAGQVFVLGRNASLMRPTVMGAAVGDRAGRAVAAAGDLDGDGRPDLLVGASAAQLGDAEYAGSVAIVRSGPGTVVDLEEFERRVLVAGSAEQTRLGDALAGDADLDGDGRPDVAIGVPGTGRSQRRGGVLFLPNPYPVSLRVTRAGRSWCRGGRFTATVNLDGAAFVRVDLRGSGRARSVTRRLPVGTSEVSLAWAGAARGTARLRVRATGRDGRRVERRVQVPASC